MLAKYLSRSKAFFTSSPYLTKIQQLFLNKKYEEILQLQSLSSLSRGQIKQRYYSLIKKYHSDNCQDPIKAQEYEEITKIIISSYRALDQKIASTTHSPDQRDYVEDTICMELFGKKYSEVKYWMFEKGNEQSKKKFFDRLYEVTGKPSYSPPHQNSNDHFNEAHRNYQNQQNKQRQNHNQGSSNTTLGLGLVGLCGVLGLFWYSSIKSHSKKMQSVQSSSQKDMKILGQEDVDRISERTQRERLEKANTMIKSILKDHPPSLKYPDEDPPLMTQLLKYSIAPDIHLYEVDPRYFKEFKEDVVAKGLDPNDAYELSRIKLNTTLTLSLEAQRALQNTYVKVRDVMKEIKRTGTFKPPQFFFKYHGFIMFQVREKPLCLTNYKDTDYISMFDLLFPYYSPIFLKKDKFSQYLVEKDNIDLFGWVYLNNKKIDPIYLNGDEKAVFFVTGKRGEMDDYYERLWFRYYFLFQDRWMPGGNSRDRVGV